MIQVMMIKMIHLKRRNTIKRRKTRLIKIRIIILKDNFYMMGRQLSMIKPWILMNTIIKRRRLRLLKNKISKAMLNIMAKEHKAWMNQLCIPFKILIVERERLDLLVQNINISLIKKVLKLMLILILSLQLAKKKITKWAWCSILPLKKNKRKT